MYNSADYPINNKIYLPTTSANFIILMHFNVNMIIYKSCVIIIKA